MTGMVGIVGPHPCIATHRPTLDRSNSPGVPVRIEFADLSLLGHREENQDRVQVLGDERALLLIALDGMGGHADGAKAAEVALHSLTKSFMAISHPVFDPIGFLHLAIGFAHQSLVHLGQGWSMESRPRATCALCLVQDDTAFFAHVGDSRVYHLRRGVIRERTRDHSHVEFLLQDGLISEEQIGAHPQRNFVECCLGGDSWLPGMTISRRKLLEVDDILLVCTDGLWSGVTDATIGGLPAPGETLSSHLQRLAEQAVRACEPHSDNTSVAALRYRGNSEVFSGLGTPFSPSQKATA